MAADDILIIHCRKCNEYWDMDHDPSSCSCGEDNAWELFTFTGSIPSDAERWEEILAGGLSDP